MIQHIKTRKHLMSTCLKTLCLPTKPPFCFVTQQFLSQQWSDKLLFNFAWCCMMQMDIFKQIINCVQLFCFFKTILYYFLEIYKTTRIVVYFCKLNKCLQRWMKPVILINYLIILDFHRLRFWWWKLLRHRMNGENSSVFTTSSIEISPIWRLILLYIQ